MRMRIKFAATPVMKAWFNASKTEWEAQELTGTLIQGLDYPPVLFECGDGFPESDAVIVEGNVTSLNPLTGVSFTEIRTDRWLLAPTEAKTDLIFTSVQTRREWYDALMNGVIHPNVDKFRPIDEPNYMWAWRIGVGLNLENLQTTIAPPAVGVPVLSLLLEAV